MVKYIKAGNKEYPVKFGFRALGEFCDLTNRTMNDLILLGENLRPNDAISLAYCALKQGSKKEGIPFTLTEDDVADLMDDHSNFLTDVMNAFGESQPVEDEKKSLPVQKKLPKKK
jgi:hypothetical protein